MAELGRMTAEQAVDKVMASEHADVIREAVRFIIDALMEAEVSELAGAAFGERAPEQRLSQRNGYRDRLWDTRVGAIELAIPKLRSGPGYFPSFLEPRRRAEQALVAVVQEAYVNGVSTRKVDRVVEQLGVRMSKDQVSDLCRRLDEHVTAFRERPLEGAYPYLWLDAKQEKVRDGAHVVSKALVIAYGVHETGRREVIGLNVGEIESEAFWREFLRGLKRRGLDGVRLCVSDAHEGLKKAIARVLACPWQRCTVHFVRDMHQHCRPSQRALVSAALREVFNADDYDHARSCVTTVIDQLQPTVPKVAELLADAEADLLAFYAFPAEHWTKLRSTNPLERVNREIGRRTDVVGIFPNDASLIRLAGMLLIEQNDEWLVGRRYLSQESLALLATPETELSSQTVLSPRTASPSPASQSGTRRN